MCGRISWDECALRNTVGGRPPCLPASLKAIGCWAWRIRATTGGCPYALHTALSGPKGMARKPAQTRDELGQLVWLRPGHFWYNGTIGPTWVALDRMEDIS